LPSTRRRPTGNGKKGADKDRNFSFDQGGEGHPWAFGWVNIIDTPDELFGGIVVLCTMTPFTTTLGWGGFRGGENISLDTILRTRSYPAREEKNTAPITELYLKARTITKRSWVGYKPRKKKDKKKNEKKTHKKKRTILTTKQDMCPRVNAL